MQSNLQNSDTSDIADRRRPSVFSALGRLFKPESHADSSLRETIEEYIVKPGGDDNKNPLVEHEKALLANILKLKDLTAEKVMIPRADIKAVDINISKSDLLNFFADNQVSRVPVYREKLDEIVGTIHIKDVLKILANGASLELNQLLSDAPVISPTMPVLNLLLEMRQKQRHMALVVDEYGGVDGLIAIVDIIEMIVGEIDDEHDEHEDPEITDGPNGTFIADARVDLDDFEVRFGALLSQEERAESDTLGGLVFHLAGRIPARGEIIAHKSGLNFEIIEADPRRISRLRIRDIPTPAPQTE